MTQQLDYAARLDSQGEAVVAAQVRAETAAINRDEAAKTA